MGCARALVTVAQPIAARTSAATRSGRAQARDVADVWSSILKTLFLTSCRTVGFSCASWLAARADSLRTHHFCDGCVSCRSPLVKPPGRSALLWPQMRQRIAEQGPRPPVHRSFEHLTGEDMGARSLAIFASTIAVLSITPLQAGNYDGPWSVELSTEQGQCGLNYKGQVNVSGGHIAESGLFVQTSGAVDPSGRVAIRMIHGSDQLAAGGRLQGASGGGQWHSPTQQCSGRWRAARL